jgi:pSer/pThr/pTyr-binding forkhead associated (FHA) protein
MSEPLREAFAQACGLGGGLELVVQRAGESGPGRHHVFEQPFVLVGRDPRTDLCLEAIQVGRRHAYLQMISGHLFCLDLDSRTGTHWNGQRRPSGWLAPGQAVHIGPFLVHLVRAGRPPDAPDTGPTPDWDPTEARQTRPPAGRGAIVEFLRHGRTEARCRLTRVLTLVGRSPACRLHLSSSRVSRYHAALLRTPAGLWVIDLQARGGIRVGGTRVAWTRLTDGDRLEVGGFTMRLRGASPARPTLNVTLPAPTPLVPLPPRAALDVAGLDPLAQQMSLMQQQMMDQFHQAMLAMVQVFGALHREQMGLVRDELDQLRNTTLELHSLRAELARQPQAPAVVNGTPAAGNETPRQEPAAPAPAAAATPPAAAARAADPAPGVAAPAGNPDGAIHVWLTQRIAALEQEQQSRWQKVMSFVLGK